MDEFKLIVAGGRDFDDYFLLKGHVNRLANEIYADKAVSIVSGVARGADALAIQFAEEHGVELHRFPAAWQTYGKAAGHIRNADMAKFADGLLAFHDGISKGTAHMISTMRALGKPVHVVHYDPVGTNAHVGFHQATGRFTKAKP